MAAGNTENRWRIRVDTGGTFTDAAALDPQGRPHRVKVLTSGALRGRVAEVFDAIRARIDLPWPLPDGFLAGFECARLGETEHARTVVAHDAVESTITLAAPLSDGWSVGQAIELRAAEPAPILAARLLTRTPPRDPLPPIDFRIATTLGTNALLQRRGAPVAIFLTQGFGDLLHIGTQQRPDLFALNVVKPQPLPERFVEVPERIAADGTVLRPLDLGAIEESIRACLDAGVRAAAVALLNAHANPVHERALAERLRAAGFEHVAVSSELAPFIGLLARAETAAVDAHLGPVIGEYLDRIRSSARGSDLFVMTSAGGLVRDRAYRAKDSLLSGPAGGVAGAAFAAAQSGLARIIGFDMGGTSTDVARCDGDFEYVFEHAVAGTRLLAPALAIESVAAGGGSIGWHDGHRFRVGPQSAGASPGPACYGAGGPLTITDVNLLLGRLAPGLMHVPIDADAARRAFDELRRESGHDGDPEPLLQGLIDIADEAMAEAIRRISVRRGYDPRDHALVAFGGAGGQHACGVARRLGIGTVLVPADAGVLSAVGLGRAVVERFAQRQLLTILDDLGEARFRKLLDELAAEAINAVRAEGIRPGDIAVRRRTAMLRLLGQDAAIAVDFDDDADLDQLKRDFTARYLSQFGHEPGGKPVEFESLRVIASQRPAPIPEAAAAPQLHEPAPDHHQPASIDGATIDLAVHRRENLQPGARIHGPALIVAAHSTALVAPGWTADVDAHGALVMRDHTSGAPAASIARSAAPDPVRLELTTNRLRAIAEEMGERLRRTALSTNIRERLDFSCAVLDADGELVVNAPHVPVHLGALGLCVRRLRDTIDMRSGDVVITNHPGYGGSHLPDVTLVSPVHASDGSLVGYVANRAHHAEIGGSRPGSMPPDATRLVEEGVVIAPMHLVRDGVARWDEIERLLTTAPHPTRAPRDNLADLRAALAANHRGRRALSALADALTPAVLLADMAALKSQSEMRLRAALRSLPDGTRRAEDALDDGSPIRVAVTIAGDGATIDFTGSAATHAGNLNASPAVVTSAVVYVLRLLVDGPVPLNEGLRRPVRLILPEGSMLNPRFADDPAACPAVVGGNVETSQRLVDVLLKALDLAAAGQGTMNNLLFGNERFGYYETIAGGSGATATSPGADAVHVHMTNTRLTDAEILEHRFPVRLHRLSIRRGSGGAGLHRGGDGLIRELEFLAPLTLSLLTQRRATQPFGLHGGQPGAPGRQTLTHPDGSHEWLAPIDGRTVHPGDRLTIETPGGGGWGA